jgi:hypothetical protein
MRKVNRETGEVTDDETTEGPGDASDESSSAEPGSAADSADTPAEPTADESESGWIASRWAESEESDELEQSPDEQTAQPAPAAVAAVDFEKMFSTLEREAERHAKRVADVMGAELEQVKPCPLCHPAIPGFVAPVPPGSVDPMMRSLVLAALGDDPEPDYLTATDVERCGTCDGLGRLVTGSRVPDQRTKLCATCNGSGFAVKPYTPAPVATLPPPVFPGAAVDYLPVPGGMVDSWGRPSGHPHWGLDPSSVGAA